MDNIWKCRYRADVQPCALCIVKIPIVHAKAKTVHGARSIYWISRLHQTCHVWLCMLEECLYIAYIRLVTSNPLPVHIIPFMNSKWQHKIWSMNDAYSCTWCMNAYALLYKGSMSKTPRSRQPMNRQGHPCIGKAKSTSMNTCASRVKGVTISFSYSSINGASKFKSKLSQRLNACLYRRYAHAYTS